jgi:hypothetical protein
VLAVVGDIPVSCCYCDIRRLQHVQCPSHISTYVSVWEWSGAFHFGGGVGLHFVLFLADDTSVTGGLIPA